MTESKSTLRNIAIPPPETNNSGRRGGGGKHGKRLKGKYEVKKVLQKAIFGEILLAEHLGGGRGEDTKEDVSFRRRRHTPDLIVLKAVNRTLAKKRICRRGAKVFENHDVELDILKRVRSDPHENLLGLAPEKYQVESKDFLYTALPYVEGGELFAVVDREGHFSEDVARDMCWSLASGLKHLHENLGYAHNDVSLENILLDKCGNPVICDYGLAKKVGSRWDARRCISGKLPYQAPEIYFGTASESSGKADVFSLGVTVFVLICGIPPFDLPDPNTDQRYRYIQLGRMGELLRLWQKDMSPEAVDLLSRMLIHDPMKRISVDGILSHPWINTKRADEDVFMSMDMAFDSSEKVTVDEEDPDDMECSDEEDESRAGVPMKRTPATKRYAPKTKASPDSVFSFEDAYRRHNNDVSSST